MSGRSYDSLLKLPLFTGISPQDIEYIVGHTKLAFRQFVEGEAVLHSHEECRALVFLLSGTLQVATDPIDHGFTLYESLPATQVIEPERIFGLDQHYFRTYQALTSCSIMSISKRDVVNLSDNFDIFRTNLLNVICRNAQKQLENNWQRPAQSLEERIAAFICHKCCYPAGAKRMKIKMSRLAIELNDNPRYVSHALHRLSDAGLVELGRQRIEIPNIQNLAGLL